VLLVVSASFEAVERLRRALDGEYAFVRCSTVAAAAMTLADGSVAALLLEPTDAAGVPTAALARSARAWDAEIPLIALVRRAQGWSAATLALIEARPSLVVLAEDLDISSVVRSLSARLRQAAFVSSVWAELEADVPDGLRPLVRFALARSTEPLSVQGIADALGLHRKTLWSRCRRHGVENVQAIMTWCRLVAAAHALRTCSRPVDAIANELAFASPTALRNAVRRHLGMTPSALRAAGGERVACVEFRAWMRRLRTPPEVTLSDVA
jgi:AraC-like DNA-binding protein